MLDGINIEDALEPLHSLLCQILPAYNEILYQSKDISLPSFFPIQSK